MEFNKLKTTQYGNHGETYLSEFAASVGCRAYKPAMDGSNPVDSLTACKNKKTHKWSVASIEIKTKAKMIYYNATGVDTKDWIEYQQFPVPVYILFVDYLKGAIYGQWTSKLTPVEIKYNSKEPLTFFNLNQMEEYRKLSKEEILQLKQLENSNYKLW